MDIKYTIGYIDEDNREVLKYKRKLRNYGFNVIGYKFKQGMSINELMEQVYKKNEIELLMIDFNLKSSNIVTFDGNEVESDFYDKRPLFPHIIFTSDTDYAEQFVEDWKIIFDKGEVFKDQESTKRFVMILEKSIEQYKKHVSKQKDILSDLLTKKEEGLSVSEKDKLIKTQQYLASLDRTHINEVPEQLLLDSVIDDLSNTKEEANKFLQSLIDNKYDGK